MDHCQDQSKLFESLRDETRPHPGNRTERKEAGLLGPTKPTGVKLGRPWPKVTQFGTLLRQLHTKLGPTETLAMFPVLKLYGPQLGPKWGQVAPSWTEVGPKLKGALLAEVDPKWSQWCGHVGPKRCIWTILGPKCANYDSPVHFLAACSIRKCHPQLKLYQTLPDWQISPFVSLAAKLPRCHVPKQCSCRWWTSVEMISLPHSPTANFPDMNVPPCIAMTLRSGGISPPSTATRSSTLSRRGLHRYWVATGLVSPWKMMVRWGLSPHSCLRLNPSPIEVREGQGPASCALGQVVGFLKVLLSRRPLSKANAFKH